MDVVCRCECGTQFKVDEKYAGKKAKCPKCAAVVIVPQAGGESQTTSSTSVPAAAPAPFRASSSSSSIQINPQAGAAPRRDSSSSSSIQIKIPDRAPAPKSESAIQIQIAPAAHAAPLKPATASAPTIPAISVAAHPSSISPLPVASPAASGPSPVKKPGPVKKQGALAILPIVGGGVLALIIVGGGFGVYKWMTTPQAKSAAGKPVLVVDLANIERGDASISIDGKKQKVPGSGEVKYELKSGEHLLRLQRRGYESIEDTVTLKTGERLPYKPQWRTSSGAVAQFPGSTGVATPGSSFGPTSSSGVEGFGGWLQNFEVAKRRAGQGKKDLMLVFVGSDWSEQSQAIRSEVFLSKEFRQLADSKFIPVVIDLPRGSEAYNMIEDRAQNARLRQQFHVSPEDLPAVVLADVLGRPYAMLETYDRGRGTAYLDKLKKSLEERAERDRLLSLPQAATGEARLTAANEAAAWLQKRKLVGHFGREVQAWMQFAREYDPNNEQGRHEVLFEADWLCRLNDMLENITVDRLKRHVGELTQWQQSRKFRDGDRGARLHLLAAMLLESLQDHAGAGQQVQLGLAYNPTDPELRDTLKRGATALEHAGELSFGTGFVVGAEGYVMTNNHVIDGPGNIVVRLSADKKDNVGATIVARDAVRDMALLKVEVPAGIKLAPVVISSAAVRRGSKVAAFGFPLSDRIGYSLKFTQGAIGALADPTNKGMLLLDMRVNPGNSGGPLSNTRGHVIGMVTAKTVADGGDEDTYGMARPATDLTEFLKRNLPGYKPPAADGSKESFEWDEVDHRLSPSVVMILKVQ